MKWSLLAVLLGATQGAYFETSIPTGGTKCYNEDVPTNTLFVAEVVPKDGAQVHAVVKLEGEPTPYFDEQSSSAMKTAFTVPQTSRVYLCVTKAPINAKERTTVGIQMLHGAQAKDFTNLATKEHLDPVVEELRVAEDLLRDFGERQSRMVGHENSSRLLVEKTHRSVLIMAAVSIFIVVAGNTIIAAYLKSYFRQKKII